MDQPEVEQEINPLSQSEAQELVFVMEQQAEPMPSLDLTPENWYAEFGESGEVKTPIGPVIMGENQYLKMQAKGRAGQFGMVKPTLTNPDVIIEEQSREESVINKRKTNLIFVKTFTDSEGKKHTHFESVTASKENKEVVVSSHIIRPQQLLQKLTDGRIVYTATALNASEQTFAEYPSNTDIYNELTFLVGYPIPLPGRASLRQQTIDTISTVGMIPIVESTLVDTQRTQGLVHSFRAADNQTDHLCFFICR